MSLEVIMNEVWGVSVPTLPNGRRKWPDSIKVKVVERVAAGSKITDIANEIGAAQSLVSKWVKRPTEPSAVPAFVEMIPSAGTRCHQSPSTLETCQLQIGDTTVSISFGYPASHLTEILRAVRMSQ